MSHRKVFAECFKLAFGDTNSLTRLRHGVFAPSARLRQPPHLTSQVQHLCRALGQLLAH